MDAQRELSEFERVLPPDLLALLERRDSGAAILRELMERYPPAVVCGATPEQRVWELSGLFFKAQNRFYESLSVFSGLYDQMLRGQRQADKRVHKGMPLVWISDLFRIIGWLVHAKRHLMLTLCEDAIADKGVIKPEGGVYFRAVWLYGLPEAKLVEYGQKAYDISQTDDVLGRYPEWVLQELDREWITELPSPAEALAFTANHQYMQHLTDQLGDGSGKTLELLADYIVSCMPGCRTMRRRKSGSTDYDLVCSVEGFDVDFRSELGRYFVCECKDWSEPADFTTLAKFCRVLDSTKSRFGILFSKNGITGTGRTTHAAREQLKVFQDRGMIIIVVDESDLRRVASGTSFISLLRAKYTAVRLDLVSGAVEQ
ncbi:MAG: hypothetical protein GX616_06815 [Planctomycetes bacterium]|nr:hypothetical protein [Planctomycetota bacterium]